jgi:7,8-dihydropterin-6-yl-methyl-4-(beta-D-ribofuranosyl)aminobenzene 5'-phosphate synthase
MNKLLLIYLIFVLGGCSQDNKRELNVQNKTDFREIQENTIINLYDAFGDDKEGLIKDFGFSCIIKYKGKTILFDGGTNADIFQNNVEAMNIDLSKVDFAIASHSHFDHINGFDYLLKVNPDVKIYFPFDLFWGANIPFDVSGTDSTIIDSLDKRMQYFGGDFKDYHFNQTGRFWNANIEFVKENTEIEPGIKLITTSSPNMGYFNKYPSLDACENCEAHNAKFNGLKEISLSLKSNEGEILFVGCSHSTVEKIIVESKDFTNNEIEMVYGGYHLLPYDRTALTELTSRLKNDMKVKKVAPAHCTGHLAFKILQDSFREDYVFAGLGEIVEF